ncbi:MAG: hypothetical protein JWR85_968 [Marmoricola sp.]|nr:hypothetical protein [Marmoricola sp.]
MPIIAWIAIWTLVIAVVSTLWVRDVRRQRSRSRVAAATRARQDAERFDRVNEGTVLRKGQIESGSAPGVFGSG